jgi:NDP-sugar pyrophosphorylase family protein
MHRRSVKIDLGVIETGQDFRISNYIEKPTYPFLVSMGIYVFEPCVLDYIPRDQYLDFPDLVLRLIDAGEKVCGFPFDGYWQDLGRPDDYEQAIAEFDSLRDQILGPPSSRVE